MSHASTPVRQYVIKGLLALLFLLFSSSAHGAASSQTITVRVWADHDDNLIITPTHLQWDHLEGEFPGSWDLFASSPKYNGVPKEQRFNGTEINGKKWTTIWEAPPDRPTKSKLSATTKYAKLLKAGKKFTVLKATSTFGGGVNTPPTIKQQPDAGNGYALILHFGDIDGDGPSFLEIAVSLDGDTSSPNPTPTGTSCRTGYWRVNLRGERTWVCPHKPKHASPAQDRVNLRVPTAR